MSSPIALPSSPATQPRSQPYTAPKFVSYNSPSVNSSQPRRLSDASASASAMDIDPLLHAEESVNGVEQDIDELISSSDERPEPSASGSGVGQNGRAEGSKKPRARAARKKVEPGPQSKCQWKDCGLDVASQESLIAHIHEVHIPEGQEEYFCQWVPCSKNSQKQANRMGLVTHVRTHTNERPYKCPQEGCDKAFTRNDAMNKHLRTFHADKHEELKELKNKERRGAGASSTISATRPPRQPAPPRASHPTPAPPSGLRPTDKALMEDPDLSDVIPRLRARQRFWTTTEDDERILAEVRSRYPRPLPGEKDDFDMGRADEYPEQCQDESEAHDADGKVVLVGRSQWQVRYIVAKAKLMLVEEENAMRKQQLLELMDQETKLVHQQGLAQ